MAITIPYSFVAFTRIESAKVNANFDTLAAQALDKTGDAMTGPLTLGTVTSATLSASENNWAPSGISEAAVLLVATGAANRTVTGIADSDAAVGRLLYLHNASDTYSITLSHASGSSSTGNKFRCANLSNAVIDPGATATLLYNGTLWIVMAGI